MTLNELYRDLLKTASEKEAGTDIDELKSDSFDQHQLDCLLHPDKHAPVWKFGECTCSEGESPCATSCIFSAIERSESGQVVIDPEKCVGCEACIDACKSGKITASKDILPALYAIKKR